MLVNLARSIPSDSDVITIFFFTSARTLTAIGTGFDARFVANTGVVCYHRFRNERVSSLLLPVVGYKQTSYDNHSCFQWKGSSTDAWQTPAIRTHALHSNEVLIFDFHVEIVRQQPAPERPQMDDTIARDQARERPYPKTYHREQ
jgi:hypothetical protein